MEAALQIRNLQPKVQLRPRVQQSSATIPTQPCGTEPPPPQCAG